MQHSKIIKRDKSAEIKSAEVVKKHSFIFHSLWDPIDK
jgi:hypothetical protein